MGSEEHPDCTEKCHSTQHGDIITAAISRRSVSDLELCAYLAYVCTNCESVRDSLGRTALHVAASCGRIDLVRWLVQKRQANVNARDDESGFTALHRSVFYGNINVAVELIKLGANTAVLDSNSLTMLEHAMKDGFFPEPAVDFGGEIYVWGSNCNNSLGPQQSRLVPELHDVFHKKYPNEFVTGVCVDKFHSVFLTGSGKAFSCGHGQGGRLGLGTQQAIMVPEMIHFPESNNAEEFSCIQAAIARDHSVFLGADGRIFSCGLNTHRVLGISPPPSQALLPTPLRHFSDPIKGVCVGQYHSAAWSSKSLYTWGLNAGQLGHKVVSDDKYIIHPKSVKMLNISETQIKAVDSSDGAICVYTAKGDIYILHEYQCRKIASRQLNVVQLSIFGGKLNSSLSKDLTVEPQRELKVVVLTNTGNLLLWQESDPQLCRCIFPIARALIVKQVVVNLSCLLFVTGDGEAFQGYIRPRKKKSGVATTTPAVGEKSAFHKFLDREDCISVKLSKFQRVHRAICIESDDKGLDFCVIQAAPYKRFTAPENLESDMKNNLSLLLEESQEDDVLFKIGDRYFPAHKCIVAARSGHFEKLFLSDCDKVVELHGYNDLIFEQFLQFLYTSECELLKCGECPERFKELCHSKKSTPCPAEIDAEELAGQSAFAVYQSPDYKLNKSSNQVQDGNSANIKNPVRMLHEMAKKFGCVELCNVLAHYEMQKYAIKMKTSKKVHVRPLQFDREALFDFCDVRIKCADGQEVKAHKCILSAQSDYFNSMFSTRWQGTDTSSISLPCSPTIVESLLEFLYTDTLLYLNNNKEQDHLFKLIVLADQLFITGLKERCEQLLFHCLTLRNAVQFLSFANIYNADKLKYSCLKFIVSNMAPLLEMRAFDDLDDSLLKEVSQFYFEEKPDVCCRVITPYSTAPLEEVIVSISSAYPVSLDDVPCDKKTNTPNNSTSSGTKNRRSRGHKSSHSQSFVDQDKAGQKLSECDDGNNIIQFPDSPVISSIMESVVPSRLKAIKLAEERLNSEDLQPNFTRLSKGGNDDVLGTSFEDFPILNSPPNDFTHGKSPLRSATVDNINANSKHKMFKMSQKQRKRLSSESGTPKVITSPESPKNPWKTVAQPITSSSAETSISDIISSERRQKENLVKIRSKLLIYTQIEDKAMEDLVKFYNADNTSDEFIVVERVDIGAIAAPVWVPGVKKLDY